MSGFDDFARMAEDDFGCRCTTALLHHAEDAERLYSSDPQFVSPTGRKRFADAPAMAQMKVEAKPQWFEGEQRIRAMFAEADKLIDSGCLCLLNLPVTDANGRLQGQVNLALPEGRLDCKGLAALATQAQGLLPIFLAARSGSP